MNVNNEDRSFHINVPFGGGGGNGKDNDDGVMMSTTTDAVQIFSVLDGHGGSACVDYTTQHFPLAFTTAFASINTDTDNTTAADIRRLIRSTVLSLDDAFLRDYASQTIGRDHRETRKSLATGACMVGLFVTPTSMHIAHLGDTGAMLCVRDYNNKTAATSIRVCVCVCVCGCFFFNSFSSLLGPEANIGTQSQ